MTYNSSVFWSNKNELPIVIDSGTSKSITPVSSDFIGKISTMDTPIQGLLETTKIKGIGKVKWCICDSKWTSTSIETTAYFIPQADIRLFSPQAYFNENKSGSFVMDSTGRVLTLPNQLSLYFDYHKGNNLRMATSVPSDMVAAVCMAFDAFTSQDVSSSLVEEHNQNLSQAQKELLQWHWKLGHCGFQQIQTLLHSSHNFYQTQGKLFMSHTSLCFMQNSSFNLPNTNII